MADTLTNTTTAFDPAAHGFRVATGPIRRKPRRPSAKKTPKPQYADAVWYSFLNDHPLEAVVPVRSVEDTIRKLKAAARYLERTEGREVRVQIGVEPELDADNQPTKRSVVKFLGHEPWVLGRRVAKLAAEAEPEPTPPAPTPIPAPRSGGSRAQRSPRRTVAGTRTTAAHRRSRASLPGALVRAVISPVGVPVVPSYGRGDFGIFMEFRPLLRPALYASFALPPAHIGRGVFPG